MVEWKKLGDVCTFNRGRTITAREAVEGSVPVIAGGQAPSYYHNEANRSGESITVAGSGAYAGFVIYWNQPIFVSDAFTVDPDKSLLHKYVFQWLKMNQQRIFETQKGAGVPHVHGKDIAGFVIPIPPLSEQTRIVGILDTFTAAIENLKQQIAERRKQYEYYRNELLDLEGKEGVEMKTLGEVCSIKTGKGITQEVCSDEYPYPVISGGKTPMGCFWDFNRNENTVTVSRVGAYAGFVSFITEKFYLNDKCFSVIPNGSFVEPKFLYNHLKNKEVSIKQLQSEGGVPTINTQKLNTLTIPIPSIREQSRIVSILDTFEASIANLEAQLKEREKQYEYYRNKLLTFE